MRTIDLILTCVGMAMNLLLAYPMFDCLWAKKKHVKLPLLLLLTSAALYILCMLAFGGGAAQPFFGLLPLLALTLLFETKTWQRILFCTVFFTVACTSQLMVELVCDLLFRSNISSRPIFCTPYRSRFSPNPSCLRSSQGSASNKKAPFPRRQKNTTC